MAQHGGESLHIHAALQGQGGESVPQIVKSDSLTPGPLQNDLEPPSHRARCHGHVLFDRRGEHPPGVHRLLILPQHLHHAGRQDQSADGGAGFRDTHLELSLHLVDLLVHGQGPGLEVQVVPLEGQQFAPPQAGT